MGYITFTSVDNSGTIQCQVQKIVMAKTWKIQYYQILLTLIRNTLKHSYIKLIFMDSSCDIINFYVLVRHVLSVAETPASVPGPWSCEKGSLSYFSAILSMKLVKYIEKVRTAYVMAENASATLAVIYLTYSWNVFGIHLEQTYRWSHHCLYYCPSDAYFDPLI